MTHGCRIMELVAMRLVEALCLGLGLPSHSLHPLLHACHTSFVRLNYYPTAGEHLCRPAASTPPLIILWYVSRMQCTGVQSGCRQAAHGPPLSRPRLCWIFGTAMWLDATQAPSHRQVVPCSLHFTGRLCHVPCHECCLSSPALLWQHNCVAAMAVTDPG